MPLASQFQAINPKTEQPLEPFYHDATSEEIEAAIQASEVAFMVYRKKSGAEKAAFLEAIAGEIMILGDRLIKRCMAETGLPQGRLQGERGRTVGQLKLFAAVLREGSWADVRIDTALPERSPLPRPDLRHIQIPLGPVGVFGASNFPLAFSVAGGDTASALAAGCTVVVKGHPAHPGTSALIAEAIQRAARATAMPEGVFQLLQGAAHDVGLAIVGHPLIKAVGFTGSLRGGKALFDEAARRPEPIPVFAEMGSINPVFVLPHALAERRSALAQGLVQSVTLGAGQFCTNPGVVVALQSEQTDAFVSEAGALMDAASSGTMLAGPIQQAFEAGVNRLTQVQGVEVVGKGVDEGEGFAGTPHILKTTATQFLAHDVLAEEVFGPSTLAVIADDHERMLEIARNLEGHLTATLHGTPEDLEAHADLIEILERKVGRLIINGFPTGVEVCHAMVHGGPFPATTAPSTTSVGTTAIRRFTRPVCYQSFPASLLPEELQDDNPLGIWRLVNGALTQDAIG